MLRAHVLYALLVGHQVLVRAPTRSKRDFSSSQIDGNQQMKQILEPIPLGAIFTFVKMNVIHEKFHNLTFILMDLVNTGIKLVNPLPQSIQRIRINRFNDHVMWTFGDIRT